jgi:hypothetical protein
MLNSDKNDDPNDKEMLRLVNETTSSILRIFNEYGPQVVEDWEVNELLEWTHNLNYDEYLLDWRTIGTSGSSNVIFGIFRFSFVFHNRIFQKSRGFSCFKKYRSRIFILSYVSR